MCDVELNEMLYVCERVLLARYMPRILNVFFWLLDREGGGGDDINARALIMQHGYFQFAKTPAIPKIYRFQLISLPR